MCSLWRGDSFFHLFSVLPWKVGFVESTASCVDQVKGRVFRCPRLRNHCSSIMFYSLLT